MLSATVHAQVATDTTKFSCRTTPPSAKELHHRLSLDFNKTLPDILPYIEKYYPNADSNQIAKWERSGALECIEIDGEKRYFRNAAANLFRIDPDARRVKETVDGRERASRDYIVSLHIRQVLASKKNKNHLYLPHHWLFNYNITLRNTPDLTTGTPISLWLPYPSDQVARQADIRIENANRTYSLSDSTPHSSAYTTLTYHPDSANCAAIAYRFTTHAEYHPLPRHFKHRKADITDPRLKKHLRLGSRHCTPSPEILKITHQIVGDETRPYYQARRLFAALRQLYPWASAREYSTIADIPQYVIENRHGDCGQITLLYMLMCNIVDIPARWQSGFMLHPGYENLHDWCEIYIEGMGWIPIDPSFGVQQWGTTDEERYFYFGGIDAYRLIINTDYASPLAPLKLHPRSEPIDFQRGEVETATQNLYFDSWSWAMNSTPFP